ncbi:glycosyltransferase family 2 protein [Plebeiibacterium marinum]|uniref:Glycosyltransferase family 2 protein n=1 Tax=Plebeiibacterium marinum TaxID=2992111 RepID=A0AAE3MCK3_9BACT|nr:glycosyltransferase family 2 protein [Plebeiobacterium marinum]MCW3805034.1 glycosyltransferase family 2 protein [Plebeiobacterium marinum]
MDHLFSKYLRRHPAFTSFDVLQIKESGLIVVIPVYLEDSIRATLDSLRSCNKIDCHVSVILVINAAAGSSEKVLSLQLQTIRELNEFAGKNNTSSLSFYVVEALELPQKHFGAGLARKIGMDLAVQHFYNAENQEGIIASLDADTLVDKNYFEEIRQWFGASQKNNACSIYYEHPVDGDEYAVEIYDAITQYELHLRYYVESLRSIGFPYAYHTVGSCFAFTANAYVRAGGMNRRQGGEEFYFIQKLIQLGGYGELNSTTIKPSSRISDRVPFGTGPSVKQIVDGQGEYLTYNPTAFFDLKELFLNADKYYKIDKEVYHEEILKLPGAVRSFLLNSDFWEELNHLYNNCTTADVFKKRFYHIFNAFKVVKYLNYVHEHFIEKTTAFDAAIELLQRLGVDTADYFDEKELLLKYREMQKLHH